MTSGVEQLGLSSRPLSGLLVNQSPIQITEAAARELQLRDGQIVKALVENGGKHLLLSANERSFRLPVTSIYSAGATLSLRYTASIYGRHLLPTEKTVSSEKAAPSRQTAPSALPPPLIQVALSYIGKINSAGMGSYDLASLLGASGFAALVERLRADNANPSEKPVLPYFPPKRSITPRLVADALLHSGLFSESLSMDKSRGRLDLKQTLILLRDLLGKDRAEQISKITAAIDRIELSQMESLIAQERREVLYRFAIPFQEGGAVQVEIEGGKAGDNTGKRAWSVSLDTTDPSLGEVSVKASLLDQGALDVTFWADRPGTISLMKNMLPELAHELGQYQVTLSNTNVINGRRSREAVSSETNNGQGSFLDLKT